MFDWLVFTSSPAVEPTTAAAGLFCPRIRTAHQAGEGNWGAAYSNSGAVVITLINKIARATADAKKLHGRLLPVGKGELMAQRGELLKALAENEQMIADARARLAQCEGDAWAARKLTWTLRRAQEAEKRLQRLLNEPKSD